MAISRTLKEATEDAQRTADAALLALQCSLTACKSLATNQDAISTIHEAEGMLSDVQRCVSNLRFLEAPDSSESGASLSHV